MTGSSRASGAPRALPQDVVDAVAPKEVATTQGHHGMPAMRLTFQIADGADVDFVQEVQCLVERFQIAVRLGNVPHQQSEVLIFA